jgi:hypothetical protein
MIIVLSEIPLEDVEKIVKAHYQALYKDAEGLSKEILDVAYADPIYALETARGLLS